MTSKLHYSSPVSENYQLRYNAQIDEKDGKIGILWDNDVQKKVKAAIETKTNASTKAAYKDVTEALAEGRPRKVMTPEVIGYNATDMLYPFLYATGIMDCMNQVDPETRKRFLERQQIGREIPNFTSRIR